MYSELDIFVYQSYNAYEMELLNKLTNVKTIYFIIIQAFGSGFILIERILFHNYIEYIKMQNM
jgi:hypothetical protein